MKEKLSEMLTFALTALDEAEKEDSPVEPYMGNFHRMISARNARPQACLGGLAAIKKWNIKRINFDYGSEMTLANNLNYNDVHVYEDVIDDLRIGRIDHALRKLDLPETNAFNRDAAAYDTKNPEPFKVLMRQLAKELEEAGY